MEWAGDQSCDRLDSVGHQQAIILYQGNANSPSNFSKNPLIQGLKFRVPQLYVQEDFEP